MRKIIVIFVIVLFFIFIEFLLTLNQRSAGMSLANKAFAMEREVDREHQKILKIQTVIDDSYFSTEYAKNLSKGLDFFFLKEPESLFLEIENLEGAKDD
ncbi:hypothetical protein JXA84_08405 [candidate division WOR-3 bacterium]|nr:hypothetical protein [candidate division WOR-3 bacterium]